MYQEVTNDLNVKMNFTVMTVDNLAYMFLYSVKFSVISPTLRRGFLSPLVKMSELP